MYEIENLCNRVVFIDKGRISKELSEESLLEGDRHVIAISTQKNSLSQIDTMYANLIAEKDQGFPLSAAISMPVLRNSWNT